MSGRLATALVFGSSFCILVLEILAGRLLAPIIGVSLETFTGIIGTVLAGIALGNAAGGWWADRRDPDTAIGPIFVLAGLTTWLAPLVASVLQPVQAADPFTIVIASAVTFVAPAALLATITPLVAKLQLQDLEETGRTVGNLSAAGTAGALAGTFATGFVLVGRVPTRPLIVVIGAILLAVGVAWLGRRVLRANVAAAAFIVLVGLGALVVPSPCDAETAYACAQFVTDPERPTGVRVVLNGDSNSYLDLEDPSYLGFRYLRLFDAVFDEQPGGPWQVAHVGGAGLTIPRYIDAERPGSAQTVLEIDGELIDAVADNLGVEPGPTTEMVIGDARLSLAALGTDTHDVVVGDAFSGLTVPWHLTTSEFMAEVDRILTDDGLYIMNLIDGGDVAFARAEMATLAEHFDHLQVIVPPGGVNADGAARNFVLVASDTALPPPAVADDDGILLDAAETEAFFADAEVLRDDFAPVDQLRRLG
ncbi:MAG: fused MFS/spermidine synthase [Actinomycetota bacterium]